MLFGEFYPIAHGQKNAFLAADLYLKKSTKTSIKQNSALLCFIKQSIGT